MEEEMGTAKLLLLPQEILWKSIGTAKLVSLSCKILCIIFLFWQKCGIAFI